MARGDSPVPIGSLWADGDASSMFLCLNHANLPTSDGPVPALVLQLIPTGEAWIQPLEVFLTGDWENMGFVWDRGVAV
jgi:hypothetical protein